MSNPDFTFKIRKALPSFRMDGEWVCTLDVIDGLYGMAHGRTPREAIEQLLPCLDLLCKSETPVKPPIYLFGSYTACCEYGARHNIEHRDWRHIDSREQVMGLDPKGLKAVLLHRYDEDAKKEWIQRGGTFE